MVNPERQSNLSQEQVLKQGNESSESEGFSYVMDGRTDSLQGVLHAENRDGTGASNPDAEPSKHAAGAQRDQTADSKGAEGPEESSVQPGEAESDGPNSSGDKVDKTTPGDIPTHRPLEESKNLISSSGTSKKAKAANKNSSETRRPSLDYNANVEQKGKTDQKEKNKSTQETPEQKVAFGAEPRTQLSLVKAHEASWCS